MGAKMNSVLIVEDEKMIRQGIKVMIQRSGVPVDNILECSNGQMAFDILSMQKVDVMFTDIRMPKMDGIELVKAMQGLPDIPLTVVVSGYDDFSYAVEMLRLGVREYMLKPVDREKVKEIMVKLNEEIMQNQESRYKDRSIGYQQLKYLVLNENITQQERELLIEQYRKELYEEKYVVCCLNNTGGPMFEDEDCIYLSDVDGTELYLTTERKLPQLVRDEFMNRYVGVSSPHEGLESLKEAYEEARRARKEAFYLCKQTVRFEDMVMGKKNTGLDIEENSIKQIVQMLGTDKWEEALRQLERIFKNVKLGGYPLERIEDSLRILLEEIAVTYQNVIQTDQLGFGQFGDMDAYQNMEEWQDEFIGWLTQFSNTLNSQFDDYKNKQKIKLAIAYIQENYDKDLNMAVVSNHISMNYSLFSYVFKQYTGSNFVNYLKEIRIKAAQRLLEESDMKIVDISQTIGYENEKHFMKTFKAVCGVSPTEYRKNMQFKG